MFKLGPQQFATVFEALRAAGTSGGSEKRQATRMEVQAKLTVAPVIDHRVPRTFTALTRDVSSAGVGLFQHAPAEPGSRFLACLPTTRGEPIVLECVVRFCRPLAEGMFGVGAEFERAAPPELIRAMQDTRDKTLDRIRESILA